MEKSKKCSKCRRTKPLHKFYVLSKSRDGRRPRCVKCEEADSAIHRAQPQVKARRAALARAECYRLKMEVFAAYCGKEIRCKICGFADVRALSIDHVNDDGYLRRKNGEATGANFYRKIRLAGFPPDFQVLCMNCQFIKKRAYLDRKYNRTGDEPTLRLLKTSAYYVVGEEKAREIRSMVGKYSYSEIGRMFGIHRTHARQVALGLIWKDS